MRILGKIKTYRGGRLIGRSFKCLYDIRAAAIAPFLHPTLIAGFIIAGCQTNPPELTHAKMKMETRPARSGRIEDDQ